MDYDYETEMEDAEFDAVLFSYMKKQKKTDSYSGTVYSGQILRSSKGCATSDDACKRKTESSPEKSTEDLLSTAKRGHYHDFCDCDYCDCGVCW